MILPNFLILGPPRTATTWLFRAIHSHSEIYIPLLKQVHYFDRNYHKGIDWYASFFDNVQASGKAIGEITPDYLAFPEAPQRIAETLGTEIQLFIVLRNPAERAFSEYRMKLRLEKVSGSFSDAIEQDKRIIENSLYFKNIQRFQNFFSDQYIQLLPYEILVKSPESYLSAFFQVLNVSSYEPSVLHRHVNKGLPDARFRSIIKPMTKLRHQIEKYSFGRKILWTLRDKGIIRLWHNLTTASKKKPLKTIPGEQKIYEQYFAKDVGQWSKIEHLLIT